MKAAADGEMKGILEYTEDPIVSSDIVGNPVLEHLRLWPHQGHGRQHGQGRFLVRQRVGLLQPGSRPSQGDGRSGLSRITTRTS